MKIIIELDELDLIKSAKNKQLKYLTVYDFYDLTVPMVNKASSIVYKTRRETLILKERYDGREI